MTIFWSMDKPLTASEILQHRKEGTWAANSIHPLLNKLLENGYIAVCGSQRVAKVNSRLYEAKVSLSDYITNQVSEVFDNENAEKEESGPPNGALRRAADPGPLCFLLFIRTDGRRSGKR